MSSAEIITTYIAVGDSFSEGLADASAQRENTFIGWTDRLAHALSFSEISTPELQYANLAIRGKLLDQIIDEQVPFVLDVKPDFVSIVAGGNDCMRPGADIERIATNLEYAVEAMRNEGIQVLMGNGYDTAASSPILRALRSRAGIYTSHLWSISQRHGCYMLDLWGMRRLYQRQMWAPDRIHLSTAGHTLVAEKALATLESRAKETKGFAIPRPQTRPVRDRIRDERSWLSEHFVPWLGRRLQGVSSGDSLSAKYPQYVPARDIEIPTEPHTPTAD